MTLGSLDDLERIASLDSLGVLTAMEGFSEQLKSGWDLGLGATDLPSTDGIESIAVLGMGGSGSAGDIARVVVEPRLPIPFRVVKGYAESAPWMGRNTLVFAVSYSGNTEETIHALTEAHERGARIVVIASGGRLEELALTYGAAVIKPPPGLQPRASLGYLAMPILAVLNRMGLTADLTDDAAEAIKVVADLCASCHRSKTAAENPAKALASRLVGKLPLIYGGRGFGSLAAYRFKCDLNEYAKMPAFSNELPEANHNEIVGFESDELADRLVAVYLRDEDEHERIARRFEVYAELIRSRVADSVTLESSGVSNFARILSLVTVTQFAAIYAGLGAGVDPGPVELIEDLKRKLTPEGS